MPWLFGQIGKVEGAGFHWCFDRNAIHCGSIAFTVQEQNTFLILRRDCFRD